MAKAAWLTYAKERFPLPVYLILAGGYACSGVFLTESRDPRAISYALLGILLFFWVLRLMDELKDFEKDKIANPTRPLPRGLLSPELVRRSINGFVTSMLAFGVLVVFRFNKEAGLCYLGLTAHLWLMYREFYLGEWLQNRPLLYAVSHQLSLLWVTSFPVLLANPGYLYSPTLFAFGFLCLGAFFTYEICRKLDPTAPAILKTYRQIYGLRGAFLLVAGTTTVAAVSAWKLGLGPVLWPIEALVLLSFVRSAGEKGYKIVEGAATLSLVAHLWTVAIVSIKEWWL